jgi:hypothetical protein
VVEVKQFRDRTVRFLKRAQIKKLLGRSKTLQFTNKGRGRGISFEEFDKPIVSATAPDFPKLDIMIRILDDFLWEVTKDEPRGV